VINQDEKLQAWWERMKLYADKSQWLHLANMIWNLHRIPKSRLSCFIKKPTAAINIIDLIDIAECSQCSSNTAQVVAWFTFGQIKESLNCDNPLQRKHDEKNSNLDWAEIADSKSFLLPAVERFNCLLLSSLCKSKACMTTYTPLIWIFHKRLGSALSPDCLFISTLSSAATS
jgi:hypothetical protein